jgi:hypothetical protein
LGVTIIYPHIDNTYLGVIKWLLLRT